MSTETSITIQRVESLIPKGDYYVDEDDTGNILVKLCKNDRSVVSIEPDSHTYTVINTRGLPGLNIALDSLNLSQKVH